MRPPPAPEPQKIQNCTPQKLRKERRGIIQHGSPKKAPKPHANVPPRKRRAFKKNDNNEVCAARATKTPQENAGKNPRRPNPPVRFRNSPPDGGGRCPTGCGRKKKRNPAPVPLLEKPPPYLYISGVMPSFFILYRIMRDVVRKCRAAEAAFPFLSLRASTIISRSKFATSAE